MLASIFSRSHSWLLTLAAVCALATSCWANLTSDLFIEAGKQFVLGGGQPGAFKVEARNVGKVPIEIKERPRGGGIFTKTTLAPGARAPCVSWPVPRPCF
ncbi:hypothetical protein MUN84_20095 [Hymenobacter sp. 5516J-16]|uniref:hypothetical protein n=1 Tax=Hymenobacter sp. 5516J-16 TaxID=2932253 RepID=UPI001FD5A40A|nr:hypothetical protein [Hymenobacter sp. 5516J-16]UOQ76781.1 hypothetical protein MUN84_20095 [Hymenobacter sp. 5516J-16]